MSTMVLPSAKPFGYADVYIDDIIVTFLDSDGNDERAIDAVPLAIETIGRPLSTTEPIQREPLLATDKLQAEGAPAETKTILGWLVNTRRLTIHLPDDKLQVWSADITLIIKHKKCDRKSMEQLVGRLIHASAVIPLSRYFLSRFRFQVKRARHNKSTIHLNKSDIWTLELWLTFLQQANTGINLNLLTMRKPTNLIITDACLDGIGGFSMTSGRAWRMDLRSFKILDNNKLEFLAAVVGILQAFSDNEIPNLGNILSLTDNCSALCWLHKNNFNPATQPIHIEIASKLAMTCITNNFTIHSQHIAGVENKVADCLSRSHDMSSTLLEKSIISSYSNRSFPRPSASTTYIPPFTPGFAQQ